MNYVTFNLHALWRIPAAHSLIWTKEQELRNNENQNKKSSRLTFIIVCSFFCLNILLCSVITNYSQSISPRLFLRRCSSALESFNLYHSVDCDESCWNHLLQHVSECVADIKGMLDVARGEISGEIESIRLVKNSVFVSSQEYRKKNEFNWAKINNTRMWMKEIFHTKLNMKETLSNIAFFHSISWYIFQNLKITVRQWEIVVSTLTCAIGIFVTAPRATKSMRRIKHV